MSRSPSLSRPLVLMGVSGCGKTTVGRALAQDLNVPFVEGDELHPAANVALMAAGVPLTDADRKGWLCDIGLRLAAAQSRKQGMVVTCSALKRAYRDQLRSAAQSTIFVHLRGDGALIKERLAHRRGHYMPPTLLQSQLDTLELPAPDEEALEFDVHHSPQELVQLLKSALANRFS